MHRDRSLDEREWKSGWRPVEYVDDGMEVWIAWPPHTGTQAVKCTVTCAAGHHAHIVNAARGIDTWAHINELRQREEGGRYVRMCRVHEKT